MGYLNCPGCARRLRVPDSLSPMELQCPACRHTFRSDGVAIEELPARPAAAPELAGPSPAAEDADEESPIANPQAAAGRILSQADEAMLRDHGSGSGLLELTREAMGLSAGGPAAPQAAPAAAPAATQSSGELDRQFQIVGTALTLANKLVLAHKTELARTRRQVTLGWSLLAAMTLAAAAAGWWAVRQSGLTELERANVNMERRSAENLAARLLDANAQIAEHRSREPRAAEELAASRKDHRTTQAELAAARGEHDKALAELAAAKESLAEKKGSAEALTAKLEAADARVATLAAEVQRLQAELTVARANGTQHSATQPASAPARPATDVGEAHLAPEP